MVLQSIPVLQYVQLYTTTVVVCTKFSIQLYVCLCVTWQHWRIHDMKKKLAGTAVCTSTVILLILVSLLKVEVVLFSSKNAHQNGLVLVVQMYTRIRVSIVISLHILLSDRVL